MKERHTAERDTSRPADQPPRCKHCAEPIVGYWSRKPVADFRAALSTTPAPGTVKVRPEWLDTLDVTIRLLNGMGRYGIATRLARLRTALKGDTHE